MKRVSLVFLMLAFLAAPASIFAANGGIESLKQTGKAFASVARKVSPAVVFVQAESMQASSTQQFSSQGQWPFDDELFRRFFGEDFRGPGNSNGSQPRREIGQGSGFVFATEDGFLSDRSYILTNNHVVENASRITVKFQDGREYEAKIKGSDPHSDIAVLEVKTADLPRLELGDSGELEVGEWVVAIGNPFGLSNTLTVGVVSATGRTTLGINDYEDFIQTDAAINPGNSGGPLVNLNGEVIGINTAIFSRSGGYMGVGFAIPINLAKGVAKQLVEKGEVTRGQLGIMIQQLTPELAESFGFDNNKGILVAQVMEGSPADKAGLQQGDLITHYQGKVVENIGKFRNRVALTPPGTSARLTIIRDGKSQVIKATIGKLDENLVSSDSTTVNSDEIGLSVQTLTPELARQFDIPSVKGVVVTQVVQGSVASLAGIVPGVVIEQVNQQTISTAAEFNKAMRKSNKQALLLIGSNGRSQFIVLRW
ncbi:MAG: DegQ family serine endoprotease [Gammaproteobacteria bacterium]|nr:DegQ family serine endoprotease [Gammaproteobacteria bacterium]